jgi:hypothetical protein
LCSKEKTIRSNPWQALLTSSSLFILLLVFYSFILLSCLIPTDLPTYLPTPPTRCSLRWDGLKNSPGCWTAACLLDENFKIKKVSYKLHFESVRRRRRRLFSYVSGQWILWSAAHLHYPQAVCAKIFAVGTYMIQVSVNLWGPTNFVVGFFTLLLLLLSLSLSFSLALITPTTTPLHNYYWYSCSSHWLIRVTSNQQNTHKMANN